MPSCNSTSLNNQSNSGRRSERNLASTSALAVLNFCPYNKGAASRQIYLHVLRRFTFCVLGTIDIQKKMCVTPVVVTWPPFHSHQMDGAVVVVIFCSLFPVCHREYLFRVDHHKIVENIENLSGQEMERKRG
jgi:hypothetical protein